jgi:hypothetical protein
MKWIVLILSGLILLILLLAAIIFSGPSVKIWPALTLYSQQDSRNYGPIMLTGCIPDCQGTSTQLACMGGWCKYLCVGKFSIYCGH